MHLPDLQIHLFHNEYSVFRLSPRIFFQWFSIRTILQQKKNKEKKKKKNNYEEYTIKTNVAGKSIRNGNDVPMIFVTSKVTKN